MLMKLSILATLLVFSSIVTLGQETLKQVNAKRNRITKNGMLALGSWGLANTASGIIGAATANGQAKYIHQMNAGWGIINAGLAVAGYLGAKKENINNLNVSQTITSQQNTEKILLLNTGLDVGYIAFGAWLNERGINKNSNRLRGYGQSVMLQGAFLLVFDGIFYSAHRNNSKKLEKSFENIELGATANGVGLRIRI